MADGPLHPAGRGGKALGHLGIEHLGDGVDHVHILDGEDDGLPQILIALDVGGHADLVDDVGDRRLQIRLLAADAGGGAAVDPLQGQLFPLPVGQLAHPLQQRAQVAGLGHEIIRTPRRAVCDHLVVDEAGEHDAAAADAGLRQAAQQLQPVQLWQHQFRQQQIRPQLAHHVQRLLAVRGDPHQLESSLGGKALAEQLSEIGICVCQQDANSSFHNLFLPSLRYVGYFGISGSSFTVLSL